MRSFLGRLIWQWQLKLLAFALAMLLWIVVSGEQLQSRLIPVPLDVRVTDPAYQLIEESAPREVEVRFVGPGRDFVEMALRRPHLVLDVAEVNDTSEVFRLEPGMVQASGQNITARGVDPSRIRLRFHHRASRAVPVRVRFGDGYGSEWTVLEPARVEPESILVSGPAALIRRVSGVSTTPLRVASGDTLVERTLDLDPAGLRGLDLSVQSVHVRARIDMVQERVVAGVRISAGPGLAMDPDTVSVRVRGPRSYVQSLRASDLRVVVALDSVPETVPPEGVSVPLRAEPPRPGIQATSLTASARIVAPSAPSEDAPPESDGGSQ